MKGYKIEGSAPLAEFEGKMVYMKDASTNSLIDSALRTRERFFFVRMMIFGTKNPPLCAEGDAMLRHFELISCFIHRFDARFTQFPPQTLNVHVHRACFA